MKQFDDDRGEVLTRALEQLDWLVVVGDDLAGSRAAVDLCADRVYAVIGIHPYQAAQVDAAAEDALRTLSRHPKVVAIGETGLDYFNEFAPRAVQRPAFERQLALASELGLPVVIHSRDAQDDTLAILREHMPGLKDCIMHCFGGDAHFAEQCVELGCHISFAGNVTFPKAAPLREAALMVPAKRLLVETDAPYLAPQTHRGKRCEPAYARDTLAFLADLKNIPPEALGQQVVENACRVFAVPSK